MNKKANEYLENTFPVIVTQQKFTRWISAKQVNFFSSVCNLQKTIKLDGQRISRTFYLGHTDKYDIQIYISPINGAGSITIINMQYVSEEIKEQNEQRKQEIMKELEENQKMLNEIESKPQDQWNKFDKLYLPVIKQKVEELQEELKTL